MSKAIQSMTDPNTAVLLLLDGVYHSIEIDEEHDQISLRQFDTATMQDDTESSVYDNITEKSEQLLAAFKEIGKRVDARRTGDDDAV